MVYENNFHVFEVVDADAIRISEDTYLTYTSLVRDLVGKCTSDIEKARALFRYSKIQRPHVARIKVCLFCDSGGWRRKNWIISHGSCTIPRPEILGVPLPSSWGEWSLGSKPRLYFLKDSAPMPDFTARLSKATASHPNTCPEKNLLTRDTGIVYVKQNGRLIMSDLV